MSPRAVYWTLDVAIMVLIAAAVVVFHDQNALVIFFGVILFAGPVVYGRKYLLRWMARRRDQSHLPG
ncbi:MAG: hypothetical protein WAK18_03625 [Nocardioidaceae bacterium]